jgi:hypothetical protein
MFVLRVVVTVGKGEWKFQNQRGAKLLYGLHRFCAESRSFDFKGVPIECYLFAGIQIARTSSGYQPEIQMSECTSGSSETHVNFDDKANFVIIKTDKF